jgi:hypothetical protein
MSENSQNLSKRKFMIVSSMVIATPLFLNLEAGRCKIFCRRLCRNKGFKVAEGRRI